MITKVLKSTPNEFTQYSLEDFKGRELPVLRQYRIFNDEGRLILKKEGTSLAGYDGSEVEDEFMEIENATELTFDLSVIVQTVKEQVLAEVGGTLNALAKEHNDYFKSNGIHIGNVVDEINSKLT